jgi:hypothetical protein
MTETKTDGLTTRTKEDLDKLWKTIAANCEKTIASRIKDANEKPIPDGYKQPSEARPDEILRDRIWQEYRDYKKMKDNGVGWVSK